MPRILLTFEPPDGGVAEHVLQLARALPQRGFEVELAGPREAPLVYEHVAPEVEIHRLDYVRGYGSPATDCRAARQLRAIVRGGRFDLVHAHSAKAGVIARSVLSPGRVPVVYSPHCFPFVGDFGARRRVFATTVERLLAPASARIVAVCEDELETGASAGIARKRIRVVHNGSARESADVVASPALEQFRGDDGVLVGCVAVLREQKRVDVLIDAAPAILAASPQARVAIIGNGPLEPQLKARATALGLAGEPRFGFFPFAPPAETMLAALDVYVLPSSWEAFPIGVLEALASGVPQVATDVGGTREAVVDARGGSSDPETGLLVPPDDPAAIARAVTELVSDPARRSAMAAASRERHSELFTLDRMADGIAAVYRDVLSA